MLPDGVHVSVSASPLQNESGGIDGGVAVARDITRIKQTEQQLKDSIDQLEHQSQLMAVHLRQYQRRRGGVR